MKSRAPTPPKRERVYQRASRAGDLVFAMGNSASLARKRSSNLAQRPQRAKLLSLARQRWEDMEEPMSAVRCDTSASKRRRRVRRLRNEAAIDH